MPVRKLASAVAAASLAGVAVLGVAAPAAAQEYPPAPAPAISDATVVAGQTVTVVAPPGTFTPDTTVTVTVPGLDISGTVDAAADGGAAFDFVVPADAQPGNYEVVFAADGQTVTVPFAVVEAAGAPAEQDTQGSALPRTGSDTVIPLTLAGVGLVAVGGGLVLSARRRRSAIPASLA